MAIKFNKIFVLFLVFIILLFTGCVKKGNQQKNFQSSNSLTQLTHEVPREIVISDEFSISDNVHALYFINDLLYFISEHNPTTWYEYNFVTKKVLPSRNMNYTDDQLIQEIIQNTIREPSLSDFFPSPSRQKVLFAELQDRDLFSPDPAHSISFPTSAPSITQEWMNGEALNLNEPLEYLLYIYDVEKKNVICLGEFSGDIGQVLWTKDESLLLIGRNSVSVYDYFAPMGIWMADINKRMIVNITPNDDKKKDMVPELLSNDGRFMIYQILDLHPSTGLFFLDIKTKDITILPINSANHCWWLEQGKLFAFLSVSQKIGIAKIMAFDIDTMKEIPIMNGEIAADLFSSSFQISTTGKFIVYTRENILYGREITLD